MHGQQLSLFPEVFPESTNPAIHERSSSFVDNMSLPVHRWFRYSAGFSAQWVEQEINLALQQGEVKLLDPFAGSGTTLIVGKRCGVASLGVEAHPFVARIARAKLAYLESVEQFIETGKKIQSVAQKIPGSSSNYPPLIQKCYPPDILIQLDALKQAWQRLADGSPISELHWLAITAILRVSSPVGTATWQYVLPNQKKAKSLDPLVAYKKQIQNMAIDMRQTQGHPASVAAQLYAQLYQEDARFCPSIPNGWANFVLTSPPYTNNYDYADATRLEMSFWGEVERWKDLQQTVRKYLVRSCTQHIAGDREQLDDLLADLNLVPLLDEMVPICEQLAAERANHGGKKPYHLMIAAYFSDLAKVWHTLRLVTASPCRICFVVGDSAPYGVYVPVERWLGQLALAAGFQSYRFEKTRDRNIKWRNRKHSVPLHEGRLWVQS